MKRDQILLALIILTNINFETKLPVKINSTTAQMTKQ